MGLFDRYSRDKTYFKQFRIVYWEICDKYCNPDDYNVTIDDCTKYLEELEEGQRCNVKWNNRRRCIILRVYIVVSAILTIMLPCYIFEWLSLEGWGLLLGWFALIIGGIFAYLYGGLDSYIQHNYKIKYNFYPSINYKIERLFDDYLWKEKLQMEARSKGENEIERINQIIEKTSHPHLKEFRQIIERELACPSEKYVFGDVEFGMSPVEIYNTIVFKGLKMDDTNEIHLGYRSKLLCRYFGLSDYSTVAFHLEKNKLVKVVMSPWFTFEKKDVIKLFAYCCKKLSDIYGNPQNLQKDFYLDEENLKYISRVIYRVGKKAILLIICSERYSLYSIKIEFVQTKYDDNRELIELKPSFKDLITGKHVKNRRSNQE